MAWTRGSGRTTPRWLLCLAESLIERRGFDPVDQLDRFVRWYREGHLSSRGRCFDIGNTVASALRRFEATGDPYCGSTDPYSAGNGSIMRLAPVPLFFASDPRVAIARSADSSRTTHGAPEAVDACRYLAALILGALQGVSRSDLLSDHFSPVPGLWDEQPLSPRISEIASGSFRREPPEIRGTGYVVDSLEAALWAFDRSQHFPRRGAAGRQPRRRCRHDRRRLRPTGRRVLRRIWHPPRMAGTSGHAHPHFVDGREAAFCREFRQIRPRLRKIVTPWIFSLTCTKGYDRFGIPDEGS